MTDSPILAIPEIGPTQNNKYLTHNNAISALEAAANDIYTNAAVGAGPLALTESQASRYFVYTLSGATGAYIVTFPATINTNNAKRVFAVRNADTVDALTIKASTGSGATVVLDPGEAAVIYQNYQDMYSLGFTTAPGSDPYDLGVYIPGLPDNAAEVLKFIAVRAFTIADEFAGSRAHTGVNPTATAVFTVLKNGGSIGSISISNTGVATFSTTGGAAESFAAGDRLSVTAPTPQDATMADISIVFLGIRV